MTEKMVSKIFFQGILFGLLDRAEDGNRDSIEEG